MCNIQLSYERRKSYGFEKFKRISGNADEF